MQVVINMPKEELDKLKRFGPSAINIIDLCGAVVGGIPLPEHHGRLIDADEYIEQNKVSRWLGQNVVDEYLGEISVDAFNENTPTILPATKEKKCAMCANAGEDAYACYECEDRSNFEPKQTATEEGDVE